MLCVQSPGDTHAMCVESWRHILPCVQSPGDTHAQCAESRRQTYHGAESWRQNQSTKSPEHSPSSELESKHLTDWNPRHKAHRVQDGD